MMLKLIDDLEGDFRISFSITGILLDQLDAGSPETLDSFRRLADTGRVEFLAETSHHTLSYLYSLDEFAAQVQAHRERITATFGLKPTTFRNTELVYDNELARAAESMGFSAVLAEGADRPLAGRSPNRLYRPVGCGRIVSLLKNYRLSDDIAFRFSSDDWKDYPLSPEKFAGWIRRAASEGDLINLFFDYETLGEHHSAESGIFDFFKSLPARILGLPDFRFVTPAQAAEELEPAGEFDVPELTSWADMDRDVSAWRGNELQESALEAVYEMGEQVRTAGAEAIETWRRLQTSDHFYYMSTKWFADGDVHKYFNPYLSPYDAYVNYMNVLSDFSEDLEHG